MSKNPTQSAFDLINRGLTDQDVELLRIITGKEDRKRLIEFFFNDLNTYRAIYKFPRWEALAISKRKEMIKLDICSWYVIRDIYQEGFVSSWSYSTVDKLKLEDVIAGLGLEDNSERKKYLEYLIDRRKKASDEKSFIEYREWLNFLIEDSRLSLKNQHDVSKEKWKKLHDGLVNHGLIVKNENFNLAMEGYRLPPEKRILWIGFKVDGVYFSDIFKFKLSNFNKCFKHKSGKLFNAQDRGRSDPKKELKTLLEITSQ